MVENCRYLGITIFTKNSDLDLKRQMKKKKSILMLIYCCESSLVALLGSNIIYLRHTFCIVHLCGSTAPKQI